MTILYHIVRQELGPNKTCRKIGEMEILLVAPICTTNESVFWSGNIGKGKPISAKSFLTIIRQYQDIGCSGRKSRSPKKLFSISIFDFFVELCFCLGFVMGEINLWLTHAFDTGVLNPEAKVFTPKEGGRLEELSFTKDDPSTIVTTTGDNNTRHIGIG